MFVSIFTHIYTRTHTRTHTHMHTHPHARTHTHTHAHTLTSIGLSLFIDHFFKGGFQAHALDLSGQAVVTPPLPPCYLGGFARKRFCPCGDFVLNRVVFKQHLLALLFIPGLPLLDNTLFRRNDYKRTLTLVGFDNRLENFCNSP